ncbi:centrosomal protein of 290 kDa [Vanessa cardui]|uniref:centrosomal protein of 290 kDa n=1 Tax=Vanessa cardui TaxID=171605 RepID=UPI001F131A68|nr:centrosomal protein of 290 kDa [Vanessa cardui]
MEIDWKEIIRYSQKELKQAEKERLCESLSWMEADDIELNFSDLKTLFRLSQDILKYKTEQVSYDNNSPAMSSVSMFETIAHQEEVIKANKAVLEQLYAEIAELEGRKIKYNEKSPIQQDSDSSRNTLSEINEIAQLENEISKRNRHIRKLLADVKILEEENVSLKDKLPVFKEKLREATHVIENLTQQLFTLSNNVTSLKEHLGISEQEKANLYIEVENLKKDVNDNYLKYEKVEVDAKNKLQQLKKSSHEELRIKELQEKLTDASDEMIKSADIIKELSNENKHLKSLIDDIADNSITDQKNESDDGKEKNMIIKLKKKVKNLNDALKCSEDMIALRERELTETAKQLQLLKSDDGINTLIEGIKKKKRDLKIRDEGIKNLVHEVNNLNQLISDLQLENETMREKLQIPLNEKIDCRGILKEINEMKTNNTELGIRVKKYENKLISLEIDNHEKDTIISNLKAMMNMAEDDKKINKNIDGTDNDGTENGCSGNISIGENGLKASDMQAIIEENEGLRNGLTEILNLLKDNSNTSSGVLAIESPSLEAVLNSLIARKTAGWFSPHMKTVMELKAALGSKDALMSALHESRKETFNVMAKLNTEEQKSLKLEKTLEEMKNNLKEDTEDNISSTTDISIGEFGSWMIHTNYDNIDFKNENDIRNIVSKGNVWFENQFKEVIQYFHTKFAALFDKLTALTISTADDRNKWSLQEENYKAEIENLKSQIDENDENSRIHSPGLISVANSNFVDRKYIFLEESYKHIRTLNENIKNEYLESKKEKLNEAYEYERKIQNLIQSIINLSDKLRNSVPLELFLNQNNMLNELILKYRNDRETNINKYIISEDLVKRLEKDKYDILANLTKSVQNTKNEENKSIEEIIANIDDSVLQKQLEQVTNELQNKNNEIEKLEKTILDLQNSQSEIIDKTLHSEPREYVNYIKEQMETLNEQNKILKEQYQQAGNKLDNVLLELQAYKNKELGNDKEINMLRHQILDLQSDGDVKASMARISGEVLLAQMQSSENQNKIESLKLALNREKELRAETEELLMSRQKVFDIYILRYDTNLRKLNEVIDILRQQYQGSLPLISVENFINKAEDIQRKSVDIDHKLNEIEDLQSTLMTKHSVYNQILEMSAAKCSDNEDICPHKIKNIITEETQKLEIEHYKRKIITLEQSHEELLKRCCLLDKTLISLNRGFKLNDLSSQNGYHKKQKEHISIEVEDIQSDDDMSSRRSRTKTLSHPKIDVNIIKESKSHTDETKPKIDPQNLTDNNVKINQQTQTFWKERKLDEKLIQTELDHVELNSLVENLLSEKKQKESLIEETNAVAKQRVQEISRLNKEKREISTMLKNVTDLCNQKDETIKKLEQIHESVKQEIIDLQSNQAKEIKKINEAVNEEKQALLIEIKKIENDKNDIIDEYIQLLSKEREDYTNSLKSLQNKLKDLQIKLDKRKTEAITSPDDVGKETSNKFTLKICKLEEKCFNLQSELDGYKTDFENQQGELERWKNLASERLSKMEQLSTQLKERHTDEVESYKAENQHWLTQLKETQREHLELRARLTEQRTLHLKQVTEKDNHIEQLRSVVNNLKSQILNMQTMLTINDPSFDLSAIVEVDEVSDGVSQQGSDRLELKFDSTVDLNEAQEDFAKLPCSSTAIWQEPLIERLRREKQLMAKQNTILRRQVKILAARERRSRLDAQNLKNQVFRISTTGNKVPSAESAALQSKIASLQTQLTSARRDANSNVALWDKWKRAQQASDRWQARYEEKCQEVKKIETSLNMNKSAVNRLEKEKRILLARLGEDRQEKHLAIEKQDAEESEKVSSRSEQCPSPPALSTRAMLGRIEAQQRRIAALELAERGNETLVSEYEKSLAEITSLKGQVLKLESALLEAEIRSPFKTTTESQPSQELQYWRNYCDMLKEENMQLTLRVNSIDVTPTSAHQHRINDLEQTVLTLRGLVSKLQADQKSSSTGIQKRVDSRPGSGRSGTDRVRSQIETYRIEISNLKRSIIEKDALLEKSKDMLKIAAEREDELLRENMLIRRRLDQLTEGKGGFMSA